MRLFKVLGVLALATFLATSFAPLAQADEGNQKTILTFYEPVEIPGTVLDPGSYQFKVFDSPSFRHIVQVFDQDGVHIYATVLAIPVERLEATSNTVITFEERPYGYPEAVKTWFYPGRLIGHEFIYPRDESQTLSENNLPGTPADVSGEPGTPGPNVGEESAVTDAATEAAQQPQPEVPVQPVTQAPQQPEKKEATPEKTDELPKTASEFPLVGLLGLISLTTGMALRRAARLFH